MNFTCLTKGDTIQLSAYGDKFDIDILEIKPESETNCICTIQTDIEVDFAEPLDYVQPFPLGKRESSW